MTNQTNPFGDVTKMMEQFKMPGVDMTTIMEAQRKGIEALVAANTAAFESMRALAKRQAEMMTEAMQGMQDAAGSMFTGGGMPDPGKQAESLRKGFEKALANMKELAEMAHHAQSDAMARMTQNTTYQLQGIKTLVKPK